MSSFQNKDSMIKSISEFCIYSDEKNVQDELDVLLIAPHPDDAEIFSGGMLAKLTAQGLKVGVCDLTRGEMGSNGDVQTREKESIIASKILNLSGRYNLSLPDSYLCSENENQIDKIVFLLRQIKPELLILPYGDSRHPDHNNSRKLCDKAMFFSNLKKYKNDLGGPYLIPSCIYYMMRTKFEPSFVVDISDVKELKYQSVLSHQSQFISLKNNHSTLVSDPRSIASIKARDSFYGCQVGVESAEPFFINSPLLLSDPFSFFKKFETNKSFLRNS